MFFLKLVFRNAFRARLRSALTVLGLVIALVAFGLLLATLKTFNRCLGRIDDALPDHEPFPRPARKPATWLHDVAPALDLDLQAHSAAPPGDPLTSDH